METAEDDDMEAMRAECKAAVERAAAKDDPNMGPNGEGDRAPTEEAIEEDSYPLDKDIWLFIILM